MKLYFLVFILLPFTALAQETSEKELVRHKLDDGITVMAPKSFYQMDEAEVRLRFTMARMPLGVFSSPDRLSEFSITPATARWAERDLEMAMSFYRASIFELYEKVTFFQEEIKEIDGRKYIVFEFEGRISGERTAMRQEPGVAKYIYLQYLVRDYRTYVFNFTAPLRLKDQWQPTVGEMMGSIKVKK